MSPPLDSICSRCHGIPETPPSLEYSTTQQANQDHPLLPADCRALPGWEERYWELAISDPQLTQEAWWVRGNYERARRSSIEARDPTRQVPPFRIQIDEASLRAFLRPYSGDEVPLETVLGDAAPDEWLFELGANPESAIYVYLNISDNEVLLREQNLLQSADVVLDGIGGWNVENPAIRIDGEGIVHVRAELPWQWWWYPGDQVDVMINQDIAPQFFGWSHRAYQWVDACLDHPWDCVTGNLREPPQPGRAPLPESLGLEALIEGIFQAVLNREPREEDTPPLLPRILAMLRPGSGVTVRPFQLQDLFIPGILDLGPSTASLQVTRTTEGTLHGTLSDLAVAIQTMGYGGENGIGTPPVRVLSGQVRGSDREVQDRTDATIPPGIHFEFDPENHALRIQANVEISIRLEVPRLGIIDVEGGLVADLSLGFDPEGPTLIPGENSLRLFDLEILQAEPSRILLSETDLVLQDAGPFDWPHWQFQMEGRDSNDRVFASDGRVELPQEFDALTDPTGVQAQGGITAQAWTEGWGEDAYWVDLDLERWTRSEGNGPTETHYQLNRFNLGQVHHRQGPRPLIEDAAGEVVQLESEGNPSQWALELTAGLVHFGRVFLNGIRARFVADELGVDGGNVHAHLPQIQIAANTRGRGHGWLQGPVGLRQQPGHEVDVQWDGADRSLTVRDLALAIGVQGLHVIPTGIRAYLDPEAHSLGIDGHLEASFTAQFPEATRAWNGRGLVRLHGDSQGDVYFLDRRGRQVGEPLVRGTDWQWRRVDWVNTGRGYALGDFGLRTIFNVGALPQFSSSPRAATREEIPVIHAPGPRGATLTLGEWEMVFDMDPYDNQPWDLQGFLNRAVDYIRTIYRSTPPPEPSTEVGGQP